MEHIIGLSRGIFDTFLKMAPYLLFGLAISGVLHVLFDKRFIMRHLGGNSIMSIIKAALLGVPLPLCSCGVLPLALSLRKNKASEGATVSFLISTPQTGVDSIIATYGMLGGVFAVFRPLAAFVMGIAGGVAVAFFGPRTQVQLSKVAEDNGFACTMCLDTNPHTHSIGEKVKSMARYAFAEFLDDITVQLIIGIAIAGAISFFIPADLFSRFFSNELISMLVMIAIGIPMYVCATASIPIAMVLMAKGLSPGAAFVFLVCGPATNAASIGLLVHAMGKRVVAIYLAAIAVFSVIFGVLLNTTYRVMNIPMPVMSSGHHDHHEQSAPWEIVLSGIFAILLIASLYRLYWPVLKRIGKKRSSDTTIETIFVEGMTCQKCARRVNDAVLSVPGVNSVAVDVETKKVVITGSTDHNVLRKAIQSAGYKISAHQHPHGE